MEQSGEAELIAQLKSSVQTLGSSAQAFCDKSALHLVILLLLRIVDEKFVLGGNSKENSPLGVTILVRVLMDYGNMTLMRFLIARSMDPGKAAKMFVQWQKWRADIAPLGFIPDSEVPDELNGRKVYLGGPTKDGHPLVIMKLCKHFPSKDQLQFKKFVVHLLDKSFASAHKGVEVGNEKLIGIIDLQQISYRNVDTRGMITGFQFLQAYYPERLARCFILHMPRFFVSVWKIISRFLEKETQQKITIVSNEDEMRSFVEQIGEDALPECYGGKAKLVAIQDVVLTPTS